MYANYTGAGFARACNMVDARLSKKRRVLYNSAPHVGHALGMPPPSLAVQFRSQYLILLYWLSW